MDESAHECIAGKWNNNDATMCQERRCEICDRVMAFVSYEYLHRYYWMMAEDRQRTVSDARGRIK